MTTAHGHPGERLPWYVNGTLDDTERADIEAHLADCERCRAEVALLKALRAEIQREPVPPPTELGWKRLQRELVQENRAAWWRPALAAAAGVIAIQAALLIHLWPRPGAITPLGGPAAPGVVLQVRFHPAATEAQIRAALQDVNATFVDGPGALGVYRIRLAAPDIAQEETIPRAVARLRGQRDIVAEAARE